MFNSSTRFLDADMYHTNSSTEEIADILTDRIVKVSEAASPEIKAQAHAFKGQIKSMSFKYLRAVEDHQKQRIRRRLIELGYDSLADHVVGY